MSSTTTKTYRARLGAGAAHPHRRRHRHRAGNGSGDGGGDANCWRVLPQFIGPQMQVPPMYSAVKLNGQPLYKLAREGVTVERKARPIEITGITYGGSPAENEYVLDGAAAPRAPISAPCWRTSPLRWARRAP